MVILFAVVIRFNWQNHAGSFPGVNPLRKPENFYRPDIWLQYAEKRSRLWP